MIQLMFQLSAYFVRPEGPSIMNAETGLLLNYPIKSCRTVLLQPASEDDLTGP